MALFYLIAKKKVGDFEWSQVYSKIDSFRHECVNTFPISKQIDLPNNALGITASAKFQTQLDTVNQELLQILEFLWHGDFEIIDLYKGKIVTKSTYAEVMNYLAN
jgi:hypothetical protein